MNAKTKVLLIILGVVLIIAIGVFIWWKVSGAGKSSADWWPQSGSSTSTTTGTGTVSGQIKTSDGTPIPNMNINLWRGENDRLSGVTDSTGKYKIANVKAGVDWNLDAYALPCHRAKYSPVRVATGENKIINLTATSSPYIKGRVTDKSNGMGIWNAVVSLYISSDGGKSFGQWSYLNSDPKGYYIFNCASEGFQYKINITTGTANPPLYMNKPFWSDVFTVSLPGVIKDFPLAVYPR